VNVADFDFQLPAELIAQEPVSERHAARLLRLSRDDGAITHTSVVQLPELLQAGDLIVVNNTRVFPARLLGRRVPSGGAVECLLIGRVSDRESGAGPSIDGESSGTWDALMHPGQKLRPGARVVFPGDRVVHGEILERRFFGRRVIRLSTEDGTSIDEAIDTIGHIPLPPYISRPDRLEDRDRYQTIFARDRGSVAAPTAGLHFSEPIVAALRQRGVEIAEITLHVGYGTFQPVRVERVEEHRVDAERYAIDQRAAEAINGALDEERRVIAVGTTTTRALETVAAEHDGRIVAGAGATSLFIFPGFKFRVLRGLLTNFHLPRSSLLMLVAAFAGRQRVMAAYDAAVRERYRFYSYGDAMLVL